MTTDEANAGHAQFYLFISSASLPFSTSVPDDFSIRILFFLLLSDALAERHT